MAKAARESLFRLVADDANADEVAPKKMVDLFAKLSLSKNTLRDIWAQADVDRNNDLSRSRFFRALELIALQLQGKPATFAYLQAMPAAERAALPVPSFDTWTRAFDALCNEATPDE